MNVKFPVIVMYVRLLTLLSLLVELGIKKNEERSMDTTAKKELIQVEKGRVIIMRISIYLITATPTNYNNTF